MARHPRYGWVVVDPELYKCTRFARLPLRAQWEYMQGLARDAAAGIARPLDPETGCGVVLRQRRQWSPAARRALHGRDGNACRKCGSTENLVLDHIVALSRGGADAKANIQTLCAPCNRRKWAHPNA